MNNQIEKISFKINKPWYLCPLLEVENYQIDKNATVYLYENFVYCGEVISKKDGMLTIKLMEIISSDTNEKREISVATVECLEELLAINA